MPVICQRKNIWICPNIFYVFRDDGTEIKCVISPIKVVNAEKYRLTAEEIIAIKDYFIGLDRVNLRCRR